MSKAGIKITAKVHNYYDSTTKGLGVVLYRDYAGELDEYHVHQVEDLLQSIVHEVFGHECTVNISFLITEH